MSIAFDAVRLMNEEIPAFSILPAVNYFYIYWESNSPGILTKVLVLTAFFFSAVGFNILSRVDFKKHEQTNELDSLSGEYRSKKKQKLDLKSVAIISASSIIWIAIFIKSLLVLWTFFGRETLWPELLFGVSILVMSVVVSDILLSLFLPVYDE